MKRSPESIAKMSIGMKRYWDTSPTADIHRAIIKARNSKPATALSLSKGCSEYYAEDKYILSPNGLRRCNKCNEIKALGDFWKSGNYIKRQCKTCTTPLQKAYRKIYKYHDTENGKRLNRERSKKWRQQHPDLFTKRITRWRQQNKSKVTENARKRRAKLAENGIREVSASDLSHLLYRQSGACYLCLKPIVDKELDHIIPVARGGYHAIGNLAWACRKCNRLKSTLLLSEYRYGNPNRYPR